MISADVIIVLSESMKRNGKPTKELKKRVEKATELFDAQRAAVIIMSGQHSTKDIGVNKTVAACMKQYAISLGVPGKNILLEEKSLDTVGQAYFLKKILRRKKWTKILLVTSDYHVRRTKEIFSLILGKKYAITYVPAITGRNPKKEKKSLETFKSFFRGVRAGDDVQILDRMKKHPLYAGKI